MIENIQRMYWYCFKNDPPDDQDYIYIKSLYIKSDYKFEEASEEIEDAIKKLPKSNQIRAAPPNARSQVITQSPI